MFRTLLSSALLLLSALSLALGECNPGGILSHENLMTDEQYDVYTTVVHRIVGINFTEAEAWRNFADAFLASTEQGMGYKICWSENQPVTAAVHMYYTSDPTAGTMFTIYGSPDQVCYGTKLCDGAFAMSSFNPPESNFIFDCSNVGGPQRDSCTTSTGSTTDTTTSDPGALSGGPSMNRATLLGGFFSMTVLGMFE